MKLFNTPLIRHISSMSAPLRIWCPPCSRSSILSKLKVKQSLIARSSASSLGDMRIWTSQRKSAFSRASRGQTPSMISSTLAVSASTSRCRDVVDQLSDSTESPPTVNNEFLMLIFKNTEIKLTPWYECGQATLSLIMRTSWKSSQVLLSACRGMFCHRHWRTSHWRIFPLQLIYSGTSSFPSRYLALKNLHPLSLDLLAQHSQGR